MYKLLLLLFLTQIYFFAISGTSSRADASRTPFIVIVDPGHGGTDNGAVFHTARGAIAEKDLTLALARKLVLNLQNRGLRAVLTRTADQSVNLDMRAALANRAKGTLLISIHINSSYNAQDSGLETYVLNATSNDASQRLASIENGKSHPLSTLALIMSDLETTASYSRSVELACSIQNSVLSTLNHSGLQTRSRGVRQALFYLLIDRKSVV